MTSSDLERLTGVKTTNDDISGNGPIVAMEWSGAEAAPALRHFCQSHAYSSYIVDGQQAAAQLKEFYNYVDMQHGV